jgi:hypothetical protein
MPISTRIAASGFPVLAQLVSFGRRSSMVEHLFCKQAVAGSNPIAGSTFSMISLPDGVMVAQQTLTLFV